MPKNARQEKRAVRALNAYLRAASIDRVHVKAYASYGESYGESITRARKRARQLAEELGGKATHEGMGPDGEARFVVSY
jgi:hypothetical protein